MRYWNMKKFLRYLHFLSSLFGHVGKRLDNKATANFNIYDVTGWTENYYNAHKIWSVDII